MMNDEGKFFSYTNKQRVNETKRLKYQKILQKYNDELNVGLELLSSVFDVE